MKQVKRIAALVLLLPMLAGCGTQSIYSEYREIDNLELIQTIGIDSDGELVTTTAATGVKKGTEPTVMTTSARTVNQALNEMQGYTSKKYIFFGHTRNFLIGEEAARCDIEQYLEFVEKIADVRLTTNLFIVKGGMAKDLIAEVGNERATVTELLESLEQDLESTSSGKVFTCGEVIERMAFGGCSLVAAIEAAEIEEIVSGANPYTVRAAGFAIITEEGKVEFLDMELSRAVCLLLNMTDSDIIEVANGQGDWVSFRLGQCHTEIKPVFSDTKLESVNIQTDISVSLDESYDTDIQDPEVEAFLQEELARLQLGRIEKVLEFSKQIDEDFLEIGRMIEISEPVKFSKLVGDWKEEFKTVRFDIQVSVDIERN